MIKLRAEYMHAYHSEQHMTVEVKEPMKFIGCFFNFPDYRFAQHRSRAISRQTILRMGP